MKYNDNKAQDVNIAYVGGGSRGWAWTFMNDLSLDEQLSGCIRLYDIDREAAEHNRTIGESLTADAKRPGKWSYSVAETLGEALTGADFVVISILPGTFDEMQSDVHEPEKYGIWQSVGDTAGPGGLVRALRTIPMYVYIAKAIEKYAPEAFVINYTNPMALCVKTLYETFPAIKAFGCCHEVFGTQKLLRDICEAELGIKDAKRADIEINVMGVNHFTWFDSANYKGIDLFPMYRKYIDEHIDEGFAERDTNWLNASFACKHRVKFDLFRRFGLIAAAGDRHLAEFMPGDEYLKDPQTVEGWDFGLTTVDWRKEDMQNRLARSKRLVCGEETLEAKASGEEGVLLIKALCGLTRVISNVNIPNRNGQLPNMPREAIVETNAVFGFKSIRPIVAGDVPPQIVELLSPHLYNQQLIYKAAIECDFDTALRAFMIDPLVRDRISLNDGKVLLTAMLKNTAKYLPQAWML